MVNLREVKGSMQKDDNSACVPWTIFVGVRHALIALTRIEHVEGHFKVCLRFQQFLADLKIVLENLLGTLVSYGSGFDGR